MSRCYYCGLRLRPSHKTIDHMVPLGRGGPNRYYNRVTACAPCNFKKGPLTASEFERFRGNSEMLRKMYVVANAICNPPDAVRSAWKFSGWAEEIKKVG